MSESTGKNSVGQGASDAAASQKPASPKSGVPKKKRRLGRGLGSLLNTPVDIATGSSRSTGNTRSGQGTVVPLVSQSSSLSSPGLEVPGLEDPGLRGPGQQPPVGGAGTVRLGETGSPASHDGPQVTMVPIDSVVPNAYQPREDFDETALQELAGSIDRSGLMQPLVVRSTGNSGSWELVAGERRFRAMQSLGRERVPVIALDVDDQAAAELALIENVHREDLNPIERARGLARLRDTFGLTQKALSERVGLDRSSVSNLLRVLDLDDFSLAAVRRGTLSLGHAKALLSLTDQVVRRATAAAALNAGWSVRELERRVRSLSQEASLTGPKAGPLSPITTRQANVVDLEKRWAETLGLRVHIVLGRKKGTGKLQISFETLEQFDDLTERLGFKSSQ
jgi:ParB family chromosome partitioning protein